MCVGVSLVLLVELLQMQENNKLGTKSDQFKLLYSSKTKFCLQHMLFLKAGTILQIYFLLLCS